MLVENKLKVCGALTPAENQIAAYILAHKEQVVGMTIQQLAGEAFVSKSAIHRLCGKLNLKGFNELKVYLARDIAETEKAQAVIDVNYPFAEQDGPNQIAHRLKDLYAAAIEDTLACMDIEQLGKIARLLHSAQAIDIYTHAHNMNPAESFQDKMLTIGRTVNCPQSFYKQRMVALTSDKTHAALVISYSGLATFVPSVLQKLSEKEVPVVFIGKAGSNLYPQYVTYYLPISDKENLRDRIAQFSSHIALQYMLDTLFGCIYNLDRERNMRYLRESIDYMDDRQVKESVAGRKSCEL